MDNQSASSAHPHPNLDAASADTNSIANSDASSIDFVVELPPGDLEKHSTKKKKKDKTGSRYTSKTKHKKSSDDSDANSETPSQDETKNSVNSNIADSQSFESQESVVRSPQNSVPSTQSELPHKTEMDILNNSVSKAIHAFENMKAPPAEYGKFATSRGWTLGRSNRARRSVLQKPSSSASTHHMTINLNMLQIKDLGQFKVDKGTTIADIRGEISKRFGQPFAEAIRFQDTIVKKTLSETAPLLTQKSPIFVSEQSLTTLIAESLLTDKSNTSIGQDFAAFKVFWWDMQFQTQRLVWLKFEPNRIIVSSSGGSFSLFDTHINRTPLMFGRVRGSDRGFQFVKSNSKLSSRFYAATKDQKNIISIYYCFVWRPSAVRRGIFPSSEKELQLTRSAADATDPHRFSNMLRRHILEVDRVIHELERTLDPKLAKRYIDLFAQMFTGGYTTLDSNAFSELSESELKSFNSVNDLVKNWQENAAKNAAANEQNRNKNEFAAPNSSIRRPNQSSSVAFDEFFEDISGDPFDIHNKPSSAPNALLIPDAPPGQDGIPPPPPPPPGLQQLVQLPAICPVNYESISANDIKDTLWSEVSNFALKATEVKRLEMNLNTLFGRESRDTASFKKEDAEESQLVSVGRLRNLEVILRSDTFKEHSIDGIIEMIQNFDDRIFTEEVLAKIAKKSGKDEGGDMLMLPSEQESQKLSEYIAVHGIGSLKPGELLFYKLSTQIPDRMQRFEFGWIMSKMKAEIPTFGEKIEIINNAISAVRNSSKLKCALKLVLDVFTTLMPRFGNTKGFRISSFSNCIERVTGVVYNPADPESNPDAAIQESLYDPSIPEAKRKRMMKLETLRKKQVSRVVLDNWKVKLLEYITIYVNKFDICQGFWIDLLGVCEEAMAIDQSYMSKQAESWIANLEMLQIWHDNHTNSRPHDPFVKKLVKFLQDAPQIRSVCQATIEVRQNTESLWKWFGEVMVGEPSTIFKYVHDFSTAFQVQWKKMEGSWEDRKLVTLRNPIIHGPTPVQLERRQNLSKKLKNDLTEGKTPAPLSNVANKQSRPSKVSSQIRQVMDSLNKPEEEIEAQNTE